MSTSIKKSVRFLIPLVFALYSIACYGLDYYWVGGSGNWSEISHWATTSGGSAQHIVPPQSSDNVIFDANSFTGPNQVVTINVNTVICRNMTWTGVTNSPTLLGTTDKILQIFGSITFDPNMSMDFQGTFVFNGMSKNIPLDFGGHTVSNTVNFQSPTGGWSLLSPLSVLNTINIDGGDLVTNGQPLNVFNLNIRPIQACIVDISNSQVIIGYEPSGTGPPNAEANLKINSDALTFISTNSRVEMPTQKAEMQIQGANDVLFNEVIVTDPLSQYLLNDPFFISNPGVARFNKLTLQGNARIYGDNFMTEVDLFPGKTYVFGINYTQTIGQLNANGTCNSPILMSSNVNGNSSTFLFGTDQSISFVRLKGLNATGGGTYNVISGVDQGNNNGWTFDGSGVYDLYWVGGSGNWDDPAHWSNISGGTGGMCIPSALANVHFDQNSFLAPGDVVTVNINNPECHSMFWTGSTGVPRFESNSSSTLHLHGSLVFIADIDLLFLGKFSFESQNLGNTITTAGHTFLNEVIFNGDDGEWTFLDDFRVNNAINHKAGNVISNDQYMLSTGFTSVSAQMRVLNLGSSLWDITAPAAVSWLQSGSTFLLDAGTSTIHAASNTIFFINANTDLQFHHLYFTGSTGTINSDQSQIFIEEFRAHANVYFEGKLDAGTLHLFPGMKYTFEHNTGQAFNFGNIIAIGQCDGYITMASSLGGVTTQFLSPNNQIIENVVIQDIHIGGGSLYLANNSVDRGNTSGWTISGGASRTLFWVGDTGNWEDPFHWSLTSGGPGGECIPTANDDVIFDDNSFSTLGQVVRTSNNTIGNCRSMTWSNTQPASNLDMGQIDAFGSINLDPNMNYDLQTLNLMGSDNNTITTNGIELIDVDITGTGVWEITEDIRFDVITVFHGSFSSQGFTLDGRRFKAFNDASVNIENSILNLSGNVASGTVLIDNELITYRAQNSKIYLTNPVSAAVIGRGNHELDFVHFINPNCKGTVQSKRIGPGLGPAQPFLGFRTLIFAGDGELDGNNQMDSLLFQPGKHYQLEAESIQRILEHWQVRGYQCLQLNLHSEPKSLQAIVEKPSGTVDGDYIIMRGIAATGGADFYAGRYSNDLGGNTGWIFQERPSFTVSGILGDDFYLCQGSNVVLNQDSRVNREAQLLWNNQTQNDTFIVDAPGLITLNAIFDDGCELQDSIRVFPGPVINLSLGPDITTCDNLPIQLTANVSNPSPSYTWIDSSTGPTLNVDSTGIYFVEVEVQGCSKRDSVVVSFVTAPAIDLLRDTTICEGDTFTALLSDPNLGSITWSTSSVGISESFTNPGIYWAEYKESDCISRDSFSLETRAVNVELGKDTSICANESIVLKPQNRDSVDAFLWSNGSINDSIMVNTEGVYMIEITSKNCKAIDSIRIDVDKIPFLGLIDVYDICQNDSIQFNFSSTGLEFLWDSLETTPVKSIGGAGPHYLTAINGRCSEDFEFMVNVFDLPEVNLGADTLICEVASYTLFGGNSPSRSYSWSTGSSDDSLTIDQSGTYSIEVVENGCSSFDTINITLGTSPQLGIEDLITSCEGEMVLLDVSSINGSVNWSTGKTEARETFTSSGNYFVDIVAGGCAVRDSFEIVFNPIPALSLTSDTSVCAGDFVRLVAQGETDASFNWSTGENQPAIDVLVETDQTVYVVTTLNACQETDSILLKAVKPPIFDLGGNIQICEGEEVILTVDPSIQVIWSNGSELSSIQATEAGKYWATSGDGSCTFTDSIDVLFSEASQIDLGQDTTICATSSFLLQANVPNGTYTWSDGSSGGTLLVNNSGAYAVEVFDGFCTSTDTIEIFVEDCISLNMYIPNAFSPNDDGLNDEFKIFVEPNVQVQSFEIAIYDRWGNLHYRSEDISQGWDGTTPASTLRVQSDVFVYLVQMTYVKNANQFKVKRSGDVFLAR